MVSVMMGRRVFLGLSLIYTSVVFNMLVPFAFTVLGGERVGRGRELALPRRNVFNLNCEQTEPPESVLSLASHILHREEGSGLVMLQPLSCCRGTQLSNIAVK